MGSGSFQNEDRQIVQTHELGERGDPDGRRARAFHQERPVKPDSFFSTTGRTPGKIAGQSRLLQDL